MSPSTRQHPLRRLLSHAGHHRRRVWLAASCSVLNKVFDLAPPALIGMAVDVVVNGDDSFLAGFGLLGLMPQLWALAVLTVLIWMAESAFEYAHGVLWRNLAQTIQHELRLDAYAHVQQLQMSFHEDQSTGGLMAVLNDDVNQLERFLDGGANEILQVLTTVVCVGGAFLHLAPGVFALAFLPVPFILWGSFLFQASIAPRYASVRERVGLLNAQLANNLGGIATIKSYAAEDHEVARITALSEEYRRCNSGAIKLSSAFSPLIRMVIVLGFTATLVYGGWLTQNGGLGVGEYSFMIFITQRLLWPMTRLGATVDLYQRAMASTTRVLDLLATPEEVRSGSTRLPLAGVQGAVAFESVTFSYSRGGAVVRDVSFSMPAGQTTAIVGATGSGKSTLIKLLLRFHDVREGRITLDGHDLRDLDMGDLRRAIGLVSQEVFLFHGTVRENIVYGTFDADDARVEEAARIAEAHDFILGLPDGYETIVGERGQKLSGGQRQRISIARAVLKDPPILILDEATASVDNETEAAIQRSLDRITRDRTTLVIAHRLSTVRHADRILVMEDGAIRESGHHEDLVASGGLYAASWRVQTGEQLG